MLYPRNKFPQFSKFAKVNRSLRDNPFRKPSRLVFPVAAATVALSAAVAAGLAHSGHGTAPATANTAAPAAMAGLAGHGHAASAARIEAGPAGQQHSKPGTASARPGQSHQRAASGKPQAGMPQGGKAKGGSGHHSQHKAAHHRPWHPVFGVDSISSLRPPRHSGIHFVARYIVPGNPKSITKGELAMLQRGGTRVVMIWENGATDMLGGYPAGQWAARQAQRGLDRLGVPHAAVYFCADFDATPRQQGAINGYLRGAASVVGHDRTGVYGGYWVVSRAFNAHVVQYGWQTYAWSGGQWDPRAALHQYGVNRQRAGVPVDLNLAVHRSYGAIYPHR